MKIAIIVDPHRLVVDTRDDGGYRSGYCILCGSAGWSNTTHTVENLGVPFGARSRNSKLLGNEIEHKVDCQLGLALDDEGSLRPSERQLKAMCEQLREWGGLPDEEINRIYEAELKGVLR